VEENQRAAERYLKANRNRGAAALAREALAAAAVLIRAARPLFTTLKPRVLKGLNALAACRPSMRAVAALLEEAHCAVAAARSESEALAALEALQARMREAVRQSVERAAARIQPGEAVLVHSFSDTVLEVLLAARSRLQRVYVCEARPLCEGRQTAARLTAAGVPVTLVTDAQAALVMPHVNRVMLGADAICADGSIVNKVGSTLIALAAKRHGRPVTVVAQRIKTVDAAEAFLEWAPPDEVWPDAPAEIQIQNVYFEQVPADLLTELVTETEAAG
jgi:translation initiation factor 2B subunit (eIF-2B alpha/beta/delta family)